MNFFKNLFNTGYKYHKDAVIIACYYNPLHNELRKKAFDEWYSTIKHLEHRIVECSINGSDFEIPLNKNITRINTFSNLWHKETILNKIIKDLPDKYKYVFWMDTDVILENKNWLVESVQKFEQGYNVVQPFSMCKHLTPNDELRQIGTYFITEYNVKRLAKEDKIWNSFANVYENNSWYHNSNDYDLHGHVGFIWGAKLSNLKKCPLYEKGLIGGSDHIMAHATVGQFKQIDIEEVYKDNIEDVRKFMYLWNSYHNKLTYVSGNLYHIYHGDLGKRDYYNRIKNFTSFTKDINEKDENGLYIATPNASVYYDDYYQSREDVVVDFSENIVIDNPQNDNFEFGGGDFGGGGAEGDLSFS